MNHVLIVDDEAEIRSSLEAILSEEDYIVTSTGTAAEALELLRDADYQAVLLDIWLPDGDGLDVLRQIRGDAGNAPPGAPEVIMISGHGTIESAVRATKLGAYDFLEKPLSLDRTLLVLRNAIKAHQLREDNQEFHPLRVPAPRSRLRRAELRRHPRGLHRNRALRLPPRRWPRRSQPAQRKARHLRTRRRRHALPRRGRRHEPQDAGKSFARAR